MTDTARVVNKGADQYVLLPEGYWLPEKKVFVRRDPRTGDVILSNKPSSWNGLFALDAETAGVYDFLDETDRAQGRQDRDPFVRKD